MIHVLPRAALGWALFCTIAMAQGQDSPKSPATAIRVDFDQSRRVLSPLFQIPEASAKDFGKYRSPLLFADGTPVHTKEDWQRRRREILTTWSKELGEWPDVLKTPKSEVLSTAKRDDLTQVRLRLEIAADQFVEVWLLIPPGKGPFPAVVVPYYEPETSVGLNAKQPLRDFALQLARRGFVALALGTPGGNAWKPEIGQRPWQPLSYYAYVAANAWHYLAQRPDVDSKRIGIVGHSYGGKWALFAAAFWEKYACVAVSDPGIVFDETRPNVNYWEPWYLGLDPSSPPRKPGLPTKDNPGTGAYARLVAAGHDLHELHALICPRPFFVSGGAEDGPERWQALNHAVAVNRLLGYSGRVGMGNRPGHTPTEESNEQMYAFFVHYLMDPQARERSRE